MSAAQKSQSVMLTNSIIEAERGGFTELFQETENGDMGPGSRLYYRRPGGPTNRHGFPAEFAQIDFWGQGIWTLNIH